MIYRSIEEIDKALVKTSASLNQALAQGNIERADVCNRCIDDLLDDRLVLRRLDRDARRPPVCS